MLTEGPPDAFPAITQTLQSTSFRIHLTSTLLPGSVVWVAITLQVDASDARRMRCALLIA